jgi:hypothetical protein
VSVIPSTRAVRRSADAVGGEVGEHEDVDSRRRLESARARRRSGGCRRRSGSRALRPRRILLLVGAAAVAVGLASHLVGSGFAGDFVGDAAYTAFLFVLAALVRPHAPTRGLGAFALLVSGVVEILQLTSVPDAAQRVVPLSRWILGSTFVPTDFIGYAVGALGAAGVDVLIRRSARPRPRPGARAVTRGR